MLWNKKKKKQFQIQTLGEVQESILSLRAPMKLPGTGEKETQNMRRTGLGIYYGGEGVYRPGEVGVQREDLKMACPAFKCCLVYVHRGLT